MPIPLIPIVAALGAGALGYYIGRKTAELSTEGTSSNVFFCGDFGTANKDETEDEETPTVTPAPEKEAEETKRGA